MAVKPKQGDVDGTLLDSNITALTNRINNASGQLQKHAMQLKLDQLQRELVYHYLDNGRISAANILSSLS